MGRDIGYCLNIVPYQRHTSIGPSIENVIYKSIIEHLNIMKINSLSARGIVFSMEYLTYIITNEHHKYVYIS